MLKKAVKYDRNKLQKSIFNWGKILWGLMLLILLRYFCLQIVEGDRHYERAVSMAEENQVIQTPRGKIFDRNGRELAISRMAKSVCVDPSQIKDPDQIASDLAPLIDVSEEDIKKAIDKGGGFSWVKRFLSLEEERAVRQLIIDKKYDLCIGFRDEVKRYYPNDMLAANVLGFVGEDNSGKEGIEFSQDALIKGYDVVLDDKEQKDHPVWSLTSINSHMFRNCKDITLTIDSNIQFIVEEALDRAVASTNPTAITAIVMDPRDGDILAMASRPSYNPNKYWEADQDSIRNRAISFIYEPGSTFKAIVAGAAMEEKLVAPNQWFKDPGFIMVSDRRIQNWNNDSFGIVTFTDVVKNSINTCFAKLGMELGGERLTKYAKAFGFGDYVDIGLEGEECGILFDPETMNDSDMATMAIGQSIAVTPLQLVTAMSAIANDGVLLHPHLIKCVTNSDGTIYKENKREEASRVLESATDKTLVGLLEQVVADGGGAKAAVKGYRIAGKTGTAQKIRTDSTGYMEGRYIASFCGFAPVEDPQLTLLVMIDDPAGELYYGGQIAAPVARDIFSQLFRYLQIEPISNPFDGKGATPSSEPVTTYYDNLPALEEGKVWVPNLYGKTIRQASQTLQALGIRIDIRGTGICTDQDLEPYTVMDKGGTLTVFFEPN